jgi:hypothetical protein
LNDLGGASGALIAAALERYPSMNAILVDLSSVLPTSKKYIGKYPIEVK